MRPFVRMGVRGFRGARVPEASVRGYMQKPQNWTTIVEL